jgi:hypothetical protein
MNSQQMKNLGIIEVYLPIDDFRNYEISNYGNKWRAYIKFNGKEMHLGLFDNLEDAIQARQNKAQELFGEYINKCEL